MVVYHWGRAGGDDNRVVAGLSFNGKERERKKKKGFRRNDNLLIISAHRSSNPRNYHPQSAPHSPSPHPHIETNLLSVRKVPPNHQRDFLLLQLLERNLQRITLSARIHQHRRIHTSLRISTCLTTHKHKTHLICSALVPSSRARSYFVMYGVVFLSSSGIFLSSTRLLAAPAAAAAAAAGSPAAMKS